jgi:ABC-type antimicrobial peptide transport system permease subunit
MPLYVPRAMADIAASLEATYRLTAVLLGVFSGVGLLLVATGVYGTISHLVADRRREMGVRMALGSSRVRVLDLVIREGLKPAFVGLGLGWVGAVGFGRVMAQAVSGTPAFDWPLFLGPPAALLLLTALSSLVPALRATRVDPTVALRSDQ